MDFFGPNLRRFSDLFYGYSPAIGPPAAAARAYTRLLIQKDAVVLLLSTHVSRIKFCVDTKTPSLTP